MDFDDGARSAVVLVQTWNDRQWFNYCVEGSGLTTVWSAEVLVHIWSVWCVWLAVVELGLFSV